MFVKKSIVNSHDALHPKCPGHNLIAKSSFLKLLPYMQNLGIHPSQRNFYSPAPFIRLFQGVAII